MPTVRVPASSANLGPGFDSLAMALGIYLECRFRVSNRLQIHVSGRDSGLIPADESNLIWQAAARAAGSRMPPVELEILNQIPVGKGLGSSAAAAVAGLVMADRAAGLEWSRERILDEAARIEGHPDNAAACVLGSVVVTAMGAGGRTHAIRLPMPAGIRVAAVVPNYPLLTSQMRAVLPEHYSSADAIFNLQRAALLVAALSTGDRQVFPAALEDRFHQPYRAGVVPGLQEILGLRAPGLLGCALSGAGPSVLVFLENGAESCVERVREIFSARGLCSEILLAQVEAEGYAVT